MIKLVDNKMVIKSKQREYYFDYQHSLILLNEC